MNGVTKVYAHRQVWSDSIVIGVFQEDHRGKLFAGQPLVFAEHARGEHAEPAVRLQWEEAQRLMDELWNCGVRPSNQVGSVGQLAATEKHLDDMRRIAVAGVKAAMDNGKILMDIVRQPMVIGPPGEPSINLGPMKFPEVG